MFEPSAETLAQFERQFERENGVLLYRRYGKGAAYRVSEAQREEWTRRYIRSQRWNRVAVIVATFAILGALTAVMVLTNADSDDSSRMGMLAAVFIPLVGLFTWTSLRAITQPGRDLARDVPFAPPLSREQKEAKFFARLSYGQLAILPFLGLLIVWRLSDRFDPMHGLGELIWLVPTGLTALGLVQACRKFSRSRQT